MSIIQKKQDSHKNNIVELISKYNEFYIKNNFNINPLVWKHKNAIVNANVRFRGENAFLWQEKMGDNKETYVKYYKIIKSIDIGDLLVFENLIRDFKLLPAPEINTAVLILL